MDYRIEEGVARVDFDLVHSWLKDAYWSRGISREKVERAALHSSLVVSAYLDNKQVGYTRVVSDQTRFAYICDVYVATECRGMGIGKAMVRYALAHPEHQGLRRWVLTTQDAHKVYEECGFVPLLNQERWMQIPDLT